MREEQTKSSESVSRESGGRGDTDWPCLRVEAHNQQSASGSQSTFDFVIGSEGERIPEHHSLSVLAGVLGSSGYSHAAELGLDLEIEQVVVEQILVEGSAVPFRSDGGDEETDGRNQEQSARVVLEIRSGEGTQSLTRWRDRLRGDADSLDAAPPVDAILLVVRPHDRLTRARGRSSVVN